MKEMDKVALRWTKIGIILGALVPITLAVIQLARKPETKQLPPSSPAQVTTARPSQPEPEKTVRVNVSVQPPAIFPSGPTSSPTTSPATKQAPKEEKATPPAEEKSPPSKEELAKSPQPRLPAVAIKKPALVRARIPMLGIKTYACEFGSDAKLVLSLAGPQKTGEGKCARILTVEAAGARAIPGPAIHLKFDRGIEEVGIKYGSGGVPPGARAIMGSGNKEYTFKAAQFAPGFKMQLTLVHSTEFSISELMVNGKRMF